ncbi:MAG: single-stranded-DNA-specific exonuclease RecJ [Thermodesulfobacteriota bacterium]|nr:single-stranded-DNA-specific exonuclease RecJ [Thermodesulfobacteriota bacterium]
MTIFRTESFHDRKNMLPITRWKFPDTNAEAQSRQVGTLARELKISSVVSQILINRGMTTPDDAKRFLFPSLKQLHNPLLMKDMEKAVDRLIEAISRKEKIVVYGDYDADGITSTVILVKFLRKIHDNVTYYIPGRIEEGYGLSKTAIEIFIKDGTKLVITVDCGISNHEEITQAVSSGIDVIVTDHHEVPDILPDCSAVINPHRNDCSFPFKSLAGVGVAFNLLIALRGRLRDLGFWKDRKYPNLREYLDLVAIGTIGDIVPLQDENRVLSKIGLSVANNTRRAGLKALMAISNIKNKTVSSESAAFRLIPRINAAGRIGAPEDAVELFLTEDEGQATMLAQRLDSYNRKRQEMEKIILEEILKDMDTSIDINKVNSLVFASHKWHPGVIGIVASKLVDRYHKPAVLISIKDGVGKGSGRSPDLSGFNFNLYAGLEKCSSLLLTYGGHRYAAGISIREEDIEEFSRTLSRVVREDIGDEKPVQETVIDAMCGLNEIDYNLISQIEMLAPFGNMNPEPVLCAKNIKISSSATVGNNHLKMRASGDNARYDTIWFNGGHFSDLLSGSTVDIAFTPQTNHWNGKSSIQLKMKDASAPLSPLA